MTTMAPGLLAGVPAMDDGMVRSVPVRAGYQITAAIISA